MRRRVNDKVKFKGKSPRYRKLLLKLLKKIFKRKETPIHFTFYDDLKGKCILLHIQWSFDEYVIFAIREKNILHIIESPK